MDDDENSEPETKPTPESSADADPPPASEPVPEGMMPAAPRRRRGRGAPPPPTTGYVRVKLPRRPEGELFAVADQILGGSRLKLICEDGQTRMGRIPGKLRRRMWIREGDLLIIKPWEFQQEKADVRFRYTATQSSYLSRQHKVPESIDIF